MISRLSMALEDLWYKKAEERLILMALSLTPLTPPPPSTLASLNNDKQHGMMEKIFCNEPKLIFVIYYYTHRQGEEPQHQEKKRHRKLSRRSGEKRLPIDGQTGKFSYLIISAISIPISFENTAGYFNQVP